MGCDRMLLILQCLENNRRLSCKGCPAQRKLYGNLPLGFLCHEGRLCCDRIPAVVFQRLACLLIHQDSFHRVLISNHHI